MRTTAIYMRVSSRAQDMAAQEPDLKRWAQAHGDSVVWYRDKFTGKSMDRPGWNKLANAINSGKIGKVVVWRLDRLGRTAKGLTALFEELAQKKVNLISLRDGIDLHTAAGRLMANVLASVAQYETEVRAERVRAGQHAARKNGVTWGGSKPGWRWKVTDDQATAVVDMKKAGKPITQIARVTGLSRPTVYRILAA
jgi:DNA invertase Pin-like site-specific DNA recombinase